MPADPAPASHAPRRALLLLAGLLALAGLPASAEAQFRIFDGETARLDLTGYVQAFTGVHDRGYDLPTVPGIEGPPRTTGFHGEVVRLKWEAEGRGWRFVVHNRLQAQVTGGGSDAPVLGLGVSAVPDRLVDLETEIVAEPGTRVWHDVDRLALVAYTPVADITAGRQAITWGVSSIFPVADLWTRFSPFELDTEEKPGIDAIRALFYPTEGLEMDLVVADRGALDELSVGLRATWGLPSADVWAGAGKLWRQAMAMGGITFLLDEVRLRGESVLPWDLDTGELRRPRLTAGADWIRGTVTVSGEYHYNGIGAGDPGGYPDVLGDPRLARGETYYLGRHYLGAVASWSPDRENRLTLALTGLANLDDRSLALTPAATFDLGQAARLALGALISTGESPTFPVTGSAPAVRPGSEFGLYGDMIYTRLALYF